MIDMEFLILHFIAISFFWIVAVLTIGIRNTFAWHQKLHSRVLIIGAWTNLIFMVACIINLLYRILEAIT
jgi:hypothetical protein